jgi:hypothetical protein
VHQNLLHHSLIGDKSGPNQVQEFWVENLPTLQLLSIASYVFMVDDFLLNKIYTFVALSSSSFDLVAGLI